MSEPLGDQRNVFWTLDLTRLDSRLTRLDSRLTRLDALSRLDSGLTRLDSGLILFGLRIDFPWVF